MRDLPTGAFACILADPPWRVKMWSDKGMDRSPEGFSRARQRENNPERHYRTMTLEEIAALPVAGSAARDSVLFLWAVDALLPQAISVGEAWGFAFKTTAFYWVKRRRETSTRGRGPGELWHKLFPMGTGYWTRTNPEQCLLFTRGKPRRLSASVRKLIVAPRREHSRKPDEAYASIEALVAGPRLELFARASRPGWSAWGAETTRFDPPPLFGLGTSGGEAGEDARGLLLGGGRGAQRWQPPPGGGGAAPPALPRLAGAVGDDTQAPAWARDSIRGRGRKG